MTPPLGTNALLAALSVGLGEGLGLIVCDGVSVELELALALALVAVAVLFRNVVGRTIVLFPTTTSVAPGFKLNIGPPGMDMAGPPGRSVCEPITKSEFDMSSVKVSGLRPLERETVMMGTEAVVIALTVPTTTALASEASDTVSPLDSVIGGPPGTRG